MKLFQPSGSPSPIFKILQRALISIKYIHDSTSLKSTTTYDMAESRKKVFAVRLPICLVGNSESNHTICSLYVYTNALNFWNILGVLPYLCNECL